MSTDLAASEVLGTYLLAGITVLAAAGLATLVATNLDTPPSTPRAAFRMDGAAGSDLVNLTHVGGEPLATSDLAVAVRGPTGSPATLLSKDGAAATWRPGEAMRFRLASPLAAGATATATVGHAPSNSLVAAVAATAAPAAGAGAGAPTVTSVAVTPGNVRADGTDPVALVARVSAPQGLALVASVVADLSGVGLGSHGMRDDGADGDATAADGLFTFRFAVPNGATTGVRTLRVTATTVDGATATGTVQVNVLTPTGGGAGGLSLAAKVTTGVAFQGLPTSENVTKFFADNLTWDKAIPNLLQNDIMLVKVVDKFNRTWTADIQFEPRNGELAIKRFDMYSARGGCSWSPQTSLTLAGPIDFLHPPNTGALGTPTSSSPVMPGGLPACTLLANGYYSASYRNAGLVEGLTNPKPVTVTVLRLGDETGGDQKTALINADFSFG